MEDFIAYNSRKGVAGLIVLSLIFVVLGLWLVGAFAPPPIWPPYLMPVMAGIGWLNIAFFGLCSIGWAKRLVDRRAQLQIGPSGVRWHPWSGQLIPWSEVCRVTQYSVSGQNFMVLHLRNPEQFPARGFGAMFTGVNRKMTGGDISISVTGTNRRFDDAMSATAHFRGLPVSGHA